MKSFLLKLFLFSLLMAGADYCWQHFMGEQFPVKHPWYILIFFIAATLLFHFLTLKAASGAPKNFVRYYMSATGLRLLIYVAVIFIYRLSEGKEAAIPFAIAFMAHYFLFTVFEVAVLLKQLKKHSPQNMS